MSVNPDDMGMASGVANEYVDLEHQVIRQKVDTADGVVDLFPGDPGSEFDPGERQLDREEIAQLVYYRRYASVNFLQVGDPGASPADFFAVVDASVGINGDLFREVTTQQTFTQPDGTEVQVDTGGEIGLLDNYTVFATPPQFAAGTVGGGGVSTISEFAIDYYNWPTGGPIVDSFDTITCGMGAGITGGDGASAAEAQIELRYDFYWDVAEQGRSTNPFGRPSTR